jgi:hypothetical protein
MRGASATLDGEAVEVVKRCPAPRRHADAQAMADILLQYLVSSGLPAVAIHDVLRRLPRSLRSTERRMRSVRPRTTLLRIDVTPAGPQSRKKNGAAGTNPRAPLDFVPGPSERTR